jgi:hypothetical protein
MEANPSSSALLRPEKMGNCCKMSTALFVAVIITQADKSLKTIRSQNYANFYKKIFISHFLKK